MRPAGGLLSHTLQCVVLTGIPTFEANTTVSAEASSIVNPLWRRGRGEEQRDILHCNVWDVVLLAWSHHILAITLTTAEPVNSSLEYAQHTKHCSLCQTQ